MIQIINLTDAADQINNIQMPDGSTGILEIIYLPTIQRWIYNFTHPSFPNGMIQGQGLCAYPNLLRQFKNIIDFGLACQTTTGTDPVNSFDFLDGNASLYILDAQDVISAEQTFFGLLT